MSREHEHDREPATAEPTIDHAELVPGRSSASSQLHKPAHAVASGLVRGGATYTDEEKQKHAMELERAATLVEDSLRALIHKIESGKASRSQVLPELKALHRELMELNTRIANLKRLGKINKEQAEGLEQHAAQITYLIGTAQQKAYEKGVMKEEGRER